MKSQEFRGRSALITGASVGIGYAIAESFVRAGANVLICARTREPLDRACASLQRVADPGQRIIALVGDVSSPSDVEQIVSTAVDRLPRFEILVNSAGVLGPIGLLETNSWQEWRSAVEVNLFGSVLVCRAVVPALRARGYGKIIQISGGGATAADPRFSAYAASKAAVVRFAETLAVECAGSGIDVNAISPGPVTTRMTHEKIEAGPERTGEAVWQRERLRAATPTDASSACELALFLASKASDGLTGKLISALWDDWRSFPEQLDELRASDLYTVRRISAPSESRGA